MSDNPKLIINIKTYGFNEQTIDYVYCCEELKNIDSMTYKYINQETFFLKNKEDILKRIQAEKSNYGIFFDVVDIDLGDSGVYVYKDNHKIQALFLNIKTRDGYTPLEEIAKHKMRNGSLELLYDLDKKASKNSDYESIFDGCDIRVLEYLEKGFVAPIIDRSWNFLQKKNRFYEILRFLLITNPSMEIASRIFLTIPPSEKMKEVEEKSYTRNYRAPYKDD
jgi:hypothetical protein